MYSNPPLVADAGTLLATLAQSSAAIVAIVGGFLVSRLVALSSERDALRRQRASTTDELQHVARDYEVAHENRFNNSREHFISWVVGDVVAAGERLDVDRLFEEHGVPRGSSEEEMLRVLEELRVLIRQASAEVRRYIRKGDDNQLLLSDLLKRGLSVDSAVADVYEAVVDHIAETELPDPFQFSTMPMLRPSSISDVASRTTEMRRLDESIREEQELGARRALLEVTSDRLARELAAVGRPSGVTSAIWILGLYSVLGVVVPVCAMAFAPAELSSLAIAVLLGLFLFGLAAVLAYIWWYARTLDDPSVARGDG